MQLGEKRGLVDIFDVRNEVHSYLLGARGDVDVDGHGIPNLSHLRDEVDRVLMKMAPAPFDVQVGEVVVFPSNAGSAFEHEGIRYVILTEEDIAGVLEPVNQEAVV